jgi:RNA polymerase sigma-70 factor (ECF subfamily)
MENVAKDNADISSILISHVPVLRRYARGLVHNKTDADDLVQDALVRALSKMHLFEPGTNLKAWLLSIVHNIFLDGTRRAKRSRDFATAVISMDQGGNVTRPNQFHRIELMDISKALAALPAAQRSTLLLIALQGLSYEETAKITGVPVGTVRSRLSRGRSALTAMMNGVTCDEQASAEKSDEQAARAA